jgi:leucyl-tRNA synthetase
MVLMGGSAMSKSRGNVVDPDEMVERYGADTCRLYTLFAAPPERDMDWSESSVEGQYRFLGRLYRFITRNIDRGSEGELSEADRQALRKLHQTIKKITNDFDSRWHFNTSIAALMELVNELYSLEASLSSKCMREISEKLALMLAPFAPYTAQELWQVLGKDGPVFRETWPSYDAEFAKEDLVEIPVQVNGKLRAHLLITPGTTKEELERLALKQENVKPFVEGKNLVKVIILPDRLVNLVVR